MIARGLVTVKIKCSGRKRMSMLNVRSDCRIRGVGKIAIGMPESPLKTEELILQCPQYGDWGDYY